MYQKFKTCLLYPRQIAFYINDKFSKNLIYFLILLLIYCIPSLVKLCTVNTIDSMYGEELVEEFTSLDYKIGYKLEDNKLVCLQSESTSQFLKTSISFNNYEIPLYVTFTTENLDYDKLNIVDDSVIVLKFNLDEFQISFFSSSKGQSGLFSTTGSVNETSLFKKSYNDLNLKDINFSKPFDIYFENNILSIVNTIFRSVKNKYLPLFIIIDFIAVSLSLVLTLLIMSFLVKLFVNPFGIKFGKIFTMFMLCTTPSVITEILYEMTGLTFIYFLGDILIFLYVFRAFISYLNITNKNER